VFILTDKVRFGTTVASVLERKPDRVPRNLVRNSRISGHSVVGNMRHITAENACRLLLKSAAAAAAGAKVMRLERSLPGDIEIIR